MAKTLLSVGVDVGTTSTQLVVSRLEVENRASGFAVPEMEIARRQVIYQSPVYFTPLLGQDRVDGDGVRALVEQEYRSAGISAEQVDTGAVIITGETSRKENADAVLHSLSALAGDFVVATAGPALESVLAAKGAGAVEYSRARGCSVLHMDIGGGTSNLALIHDGQIVATGCMNVGGRLIRLSEKGAVEYISPVLKGLTELQIGDIPAPAQLEAMATTLVQALEMGAGLRLPGALLEKLWTKECGMPWTIDKAQVISFSGGVADCIDTVHNPNAFGDIGVLLGQAIRNSRLCAEKYILGSQTIRATVIGAGCHSAQLSGSTVFYKNVALPMKNLPVVLPGKQLQDLEQLLAQTDGTAVVALQEKPANYRALACLAQQLARTLSGRPVLVCAQEDMAKALGQKLSLLLPPDTPILCIDRVRLQPGSFLDIGKPVGPALPVVVKTLVIKEEHK